MPFIEKYKHNKEISPSSLQNPSDPDATFRIKYGPNHDYVANLVETVDKNNGQRLHVKNYFFMYSL